MKKNWKAYFTFSKKERVAMIILLVLMVIFLGLPYFMTSSFPSPKMDQGLSDFIAMANKNRSDSISDDSAYHKTEFTAEKLTSILFYFDPNSLDAAGWKKLGLTDRTIQTILHYREKGGRFRSPLDIKKIWGIRLELAERIMPFVRIESTELNTPHSNYQKPPAKVKKPVPIDINTATKTEWEELPGINTYMAERIVNYRERVGGFKGFDQVKKTYGLADSVYAQMLPFLRTSNATLPKLDLNRASQYELMRELKISEPIAKAITIFRQQYGPYKSINELRKLVFMTDSLYQLIESQVKVN